VRTSCFNLNKIRGAFVRNENKEGIRQYNIPVTGRGSLFPTKINDFEKY
jgi:hypothetical protein